MVSMARWLFVVFVPHALCLAFLVWLFGGIAEAVPALVFMIWLDVADVRRDLEQLRREAE